MSILDRLQQAWQSQCAKPLDINPDQLLKTARVKRRVDFLAEMFVILILLFCGTSMLWRIGDIHKDWPWLIYSACLTWVVGFMLFNQWRRRRHVAHYDEPLLAHVEWSIKDIEDRMWQDRYTFWWYTLPIALGCIIPPIIISFASEFPRAHGWGEWIAGAFALLFTLGIFAAVFVFVHVVLSNGMRARHEVHRKELEALRALRQTLLNTEEPQV